MPQKILITEDSPTILEIERCALEAGGYEVFVARDGQEALDLARREQPALIILDLMLPKLDGYKVCRMLKFDEKYKHIPIIMFTSRVQKSDEALGFEVGADAYLPKSADPKELLDKIKELLSKTRL